MLSVCEVCAHHSLSVLGKMCGQVFMPRDPQMYKNLVITLNLEALEGCYKVNSGHDLCLIVVTGIICNLTVLTKLTGPGVP
jgi:hypothetical protein